MWFYFVSFVAAVEVVGEPNVFTSVEVIIPLLLN